MANNKAAPKAPEDLIYEDVDHYNKMNYVKVIEKQFEHPSKGNEKTESEALLKGELEKYQESFRNYYYASNILNDPKSNDFFDEAIREVHPAVKLKAPAKNILRLVNKVFVQELAETCFEVLSKTGGEDIDQQVVEDAYRLMEKRRIKLNKYGKLFNSST